MTLSWFRMPRAELPEILKGYSVLPGYGSPVPDPFGADVVLGVERSSYVLQGAQTLAVALVGPTKRDLFSWISTYAEETFPISQFCRVCSIEDWTQLNLDQRTEPSVGVPSSVWPSIILGEMLGQSDSGMDVSGVPLNRASACSSFAVARTSLLYPNVQFASEMCIERLAAVERDSRFARRPIAISQLMKVWGTARSLQDLPRDSLGSPDVVLRILEAIDSRAFQQLARNAMLLSDSAEDRVAGFDTIADTLMDLWKVEKSSRDSGPIMLAAAAILAGRGTSHIGLLAPACKMFPDTLPWYGLLAGVLGPTGWDKAWMQQAKGIERGLRQFFRPDEPISADICWPEYEWLTKTYDSPEMLTTIPRSVASSLSIELLPGVACQFRLGSVGPLKTVDDYRSSESRTSDSPSKETVAKALALLHEAQTLLQPNSQTTAQEQVPLFGGAPYVSQGRGRRKSIDRPKK